MKKRTVKKLLRSLRGFSFSVLGFGAGATFNRPPEEREVVLKLIAQLADRRILFHHSCHVVHQDMIASLQRMRDNITAAIEQIPESPAVPHLTPMRQSCHEFQALVEAYFNDPDEPLQSDFHIGIRELRHTIGLCVSQLSSIYGISVEGDLASILPERKNKDA